MASRDHTSPIEQLFLEAGFNYLQYQRWRIIDLPGLKTKDAIERLDRGWPIASFDDADNEARLAKAWLDSNAPGAATDQEREAPEPPPASGGPLYGPLMTSREAKELIDEEIAAGRPVSITAFQRALRRAAREARQAPDTLPLRLGGQHKDWLLMELGPESGGHGNGHRLCRRVKPRADDQQPYEPKGDHSRLNE